jgi:hypothetical protein
MTEVAGTQQQAVALASKRVYKWKALHSVVTDEDQGQNSQQLS